MKKIMIMAVLLLTVSFTNAQLNLGIKASYNSSLGMNNLNSVANGTYNLNSVKSDLDNGFEVGGFARIGISAFYFQPELLYAFGKKDYTQSFVDESDNSVTYKKHVKISNVDVPLLVGLKLLDLKVVNFRVFAGPKLRFNAGSSLDFTAASGESFNTDNLQKDIKGAQLGLVTGVGVDFLMLTLDLRCNIIKDMYQTKLNNVTLDDVRGNNFEISLGWKIL